MSLAVLEKDERMSNGLARTCGESAYAAGAQFVLLRASVPPKSSLVWDVGWRGLKVCVGERTLPGGPHNLTPYQSDREMEGGGRALTKTDHPGLLSINHA